MRKYQKYMRKIFYFLFCHREQYEFTLFKPSLPLKKYWHNDPAVFNHFTQFITWEKCQPYPLALCTRWLGYSPHRERTGTQLFPFSTHGTSDFWQGGKFHLETWAPKTFRDVQHHDGEVSCSIPVAFHTSSSNYTFLFSNSANIQIVSYDRVFNS